jgi:hypothetical protein
MCGRGKGTPQLVKHFLVGLGELLLKLGVSIQQVHEEVTVEVNVVGHFLLRCCRREGKC